MIELWRGSCNQWDCDEMGHMNVRVYAEKQMEGLATFSAALNLPNPFSPRAASTLRPVDQHIRFMAEVLPGKPLSMKGCVLSHDETSAVLYQALLHGDGRPAAVFRTRLLHIDTSEFEAFPWPKRARERLAALTQAAPADTAPRSIDPDAPGRSPSEISYDHVRACRVPRIGQGAVPVAHLDAHGLMAPPWFIGRVSDSVPNLLHDWRARVGKQDGGRRMGAAVLEYRLRYHRYPGAGDLFDIYSGLGGAEGKTHSLIHWILDPATGLPWATAQATAISLDLDARKAVAAPPEMIAELERIAPRGLSI
jgi:acyl-CoA thioester hydrolase